MLWRFRRWRFESPEMEAEFQAQMDMFVCRAFNVCCALLFLLFSVLLALRYTLVPNTPFIICLPHLVVLLVLVGLLLLSHCVPASQRYIPTVLPLLCTFIIGTIAWSVDGMVGQTVDLAMSYHLRHVLSLTAGNAEAQTELERFARSVISREVWYIAMLVMYIIVDVLRLTGTTHAALYVHLMPIIAIAVTTYCSAQIAQDSIEVMGLAVIVVVHTATSSVHMLVMFRDRFRFDYQLRQRMVQEAQLMEAAKDAELAQRQASQKADSMLNHILKNVMSEAHGCIDLFFGHREAEALAFSHLRQAQEILERGMRWCKKRQVMVQVNSGNYTPAFAPARLRQLVDGVVSGRGIAMEVPDVVVVVDSLLCEVVLDNAISNALRHGDPSLGPVSLVVTAGPGKQRPLQLTFTLTNYTASELQVTPELIEHVAAGHVCSGLGHAPVLSDHLGLRHMFLAAAAHGMAASLEQVGNLVIFSATLEVDICHKTNPGSGEAASPALPSALPQATAFRPGLQILCLDDSEIARRMLLHGFAAHASQASCRAYGANADDVATFEDAALAGADICILDQHLDYPHVTLYGTDIAQRLRRAGYSGFICVRSANATETDEAEYLRCGADCMIGKDIPLGDLVGALQEAYMQAGRATSSGDTILSCGETQRSSMLSLIFSGTSAT
eukprot:EG_transcript_3360